MPPVLADAAPRCGGRPATIVGTTGPDVLVGTEGPDVIHALGGDDVVEGRGGDDIVCGGAGDDVIMGQAGNDVLSGGLGNDVIDGHGGRDVISGGPGDDRLNGWAGADRLAGHAGDDRLIGGPGPDTLSGGPGSDRLVGGPGIDRIAGGPGDDIADGGTEPDRMVGGPGNDRLWTGPGSDSVSGGDGDDVLDGGPGDDALAGDGGADDLRGGDQDDVLSGGAGADLLDGGNGRDVCAGGEGLDHAAGCEHPTETETGQRSPALTSAGPHAVALTFDDGPDPLFTPLVLDALDRLDIKATFFVMGSKAERYPDLIRDMVARGHSVQNHTCRHSWLTRYSSEAAAADIRCGIDVITDIIGIAPRCLRPPFGAVNDRIRGIAADEGQDILMWDVDTRDWDGPSSATIAARALSAGPGDVILFHDPGGGWRTLGALDEIAAGFEARDIGFETLCG